MMTFKEKLVVLRKIKHLTQDEFASAVGVSRQAVYKWESGQSYPEVQKLIEMKLLFGISIDDLLDDTFEIELPKKKRKKRASKVDKENAEVKAEETVKVAEAKPVAIVEEKPEPVAEKAPEKVEKAPVVEKEPEVKKAEEPIVEKEAEVKSKEVKAEPAATKEAPQRQSLFERLFGNKK